MARALLSVDCRRPEVLALAGQLKGLVFCPAGYCRAGLYDAQLLSVHRAIIDLKCKIHRYIRFVFFFTACFLLRVVYRFALLFTACCLPLRGVCDYVLQPLGSSTRSYQQPQAY